MTVVSLVSAKGSPGVSTTAMGLAAIWAGSVVADLDPVGGDVIYRYRSHDGGALDDQRGLVSLGAAMRAGGEVVLDDHLQMTEDGIRVLVGATGPRQAHGIGPAWPHLHQAFGAHPGIVLADAGRFSPSSPALPVVESSDAVVFVTRSDMAAIAHLRDRLVSVRESWHLGELGAVRVGVALIGNYRDTRAAADLGRLLAAAGVPVQVLGTIAEDPKSAAAFTRKGPANLARSLLMRSLVDVAGRLSALLTSPAIAPGVI